MKADNSTFPMGCVMGKRWFYASTIESERPSYTVQISSKQSVFLGLLFGFASLTAGAV